MTRESAFGAVAANDWLAAVGFVFLKRAKSASNFLAHGLRNPLHATANFAGVAIVAIAILRRVHRLSNVHEGFFDFVEGNHAGGQHREGDEDGEGEIAAEPTCLPEEHVADGNDWHFHGVQ